MAMSTYEKTVYHHKIKLLSKLNDLFYWLEHSQWTHSEYLAKREEMLFRHPSWARIPQYMRSYIMGYMECLHSAFWRNNLVWCLEWQGENITSKEWEALFPGKDNRPPWKDGDKIRWGHCYKDTRKAFDGMRYPHEDQTL